MSKIVVEEGRRLSASMLWSLQRRFFERSGVLAWSKGVVPHFITSNAWIAGAYAEVVLGYLRDVQRLRTAAPGEPVHVVELGAGVGRFAFQFLRRLLPSLAGSSLAGMKVRYVITDFTSGTVDALRSHPMLRPFVEAGSLDFAVFDGERDAEIRLKGAGITLSPGGGPRPMVVIANYFFDGIPHDVFRVEGGVLHEGLVTLTAPEGSDPESPRVLPKLEVSFTHRPVEGDAYGDPDLDAVLSTYRAELDHTSILFPCAAIRCLRAMSRLAGGRLLFLSGDRAYHEKEDLLDRGDPLISHHGSFSLPVNHHAVARYVEARGGVPLHASRRSEDFEIAAFLLDPEAGAHVETRRAYQQSIDRLGPDDFAVLKKAIERTHTQWTAPQILAWVRMSGWDANIMAGCLPALMSLAGAADDPARREILRAVREVWAAYFPIGEERDLAFGLATLLQATNQLDEAIVFYERSLRLHGPKAGTAYNMALCHQRRGRADVALACVEKAVALDPGFEEAKALMIHLRAGAGP